MEKPKSLQELLDSFPDTPEGWNKAFYATLLYRNKPVKLNHLIEMYTPPLAQKSAPVTWRIGIQGAPGSGKTTSALTFPNPLVIDFDHKLPPDVPCIPMWNHEFIKTELKVVPRGKRQNVRDAVKYFLKDHGPKFEEDQSLILDSWTFFQNSLLAQVTEEYEMDVKAGNIKPNKFQIWSDYQNANREICELLKGLRCNVIVLFHEQIERDEQGDPTGKIMPLQSGAFKDQLQGHFTDFFRMLKAPKMLDATGKPVVINGQVQFDEKENNGFYWQVQGDGMVNCNTSPVIGRKVREAKKKYIPATYTELMKYTKE
jgi:AAA domain